MKFLYISIMLASSAFAGFKLPSSVFEPNEVVEATAEAAKEGKPLVILVAGHKSD